MSLGIGELPQDNIRHTDRSFYIWHAWHRQLTEPSPQIFLYVSFYIYASAFFNHCQHRQSPDVDIVSDYRARAVTLMLTISAARWIQALTLFEKSLRNWHWQSRDESALGAVSALKGGLVLRAFGYMRLAADAVLPWVLWWVRFPVAMNLLQHRRALGSPWLIDPPYYTNWCSMKGNCPCERLCRNNSAQSQLLERFFRV